VREEITDNKNVNATELKIAVVVVVAYTHVIVNMRSHMVFMKWNLRNIDAISSAMM
jgi:hypothetical protein